MDRPLISITSVRAPTLGIQKVMLDTRMPIAFGILTTNDLKQAINRSTLGDPHNKGLEAANTIMEMIAFKKSLKKS